MKKKRTPSRSAKELYFGPCFDSRRTKESRGDPSVLLSNFVAVSVSAGSTHFDALTLIAQKSVKPIPVSFLSEELKKLKTTTRPDLLWRARRCNRSNRQELPLPAVVDD